MTIDERLEALTMNLELQAHEGEEQRKRIDAMGRNIEKIISGMEKLLHIANIHQERLDHIDGGEA
jgi:hypothetical protein